MLARSGNLAAGATRRWAVKAPENPASSKHMNWKTFDAIFKREGGPFHSGGAEKREYKFPEAM